MGLSHLLVVSDELLWRLDLWLVSDAQVFVGARLARTLVIVHGVVVHRGRVMRVVHHRVRMVIAAMHLSWRVPVARRVMVHHHVRWRRWVVIKVMRLAWGHVMMIMLVARTRRWVKIVTRIVIGNFRVHFAHKPRIRVMIGHLILFK